MNKDFVSLIEGSGGEEMQKLIDSFTFKHRGKWDHVDDDAATFELPNGDILYFTTDSFIVNPIFFPGGDIGHLAFCGVINDLSVMGAKPFGLSLSFVIEEGFSKDDLNKIIDSINSLSKKYLVPISTGDTKVMEKGKLDKIIINMSGVGISKKEELLTKKIISGDKIIISGGLGEHAVALLSKRFNYKTSIVTDSKPLLEEINAVKDLIKYAKDPTRGGIASILNEIAIKNNLTFELNEESIKSKDEVKNVCEMLGINIYELACEGRFICFCDEKNAEKVVNILKKFNELSSIIGEVKNNQEYNGKVIINTSLGKRLLPNPVGRIVPRIC